MATTGDGQDERDGTRQGRQRTGRPPEGAAHERAPGDRQRADPDHGGGLRGHRRLPADHPPGQVLRRADRAEEAVHRREPHRRQHGEQRERGLHVSRVERGVDEGGEDRREVEDPGRPEGEPVGARVLGQVGAAAAGRRDLHQEVRLRSGPRLQGGPHRGVHVLAGRRRQPQLSPGVPGGPRQHDQGGRGAAEGPRHAAAERLQVLLLRGLPDHDAGGHPAGAPLCRAGPRDGRQGDEPRAQAGAARHRPGLRARPRASRAEPAGGDPGPLPLPHLRGDRAGRLRLFRGLPGAEPRAVLPA